MDIFKENNRFMGTDDATEFKRWTRILDENLIRYKATGRSTRAEKFDYRIELINYSKEENERIRDMVGFYLDED